MTVDEQRLKRLKAEEKLKRFNFGDSRQTISSIPMAGAQERTEAEQKEVTNTIDQKQKSDSLRVEFDQLKVKLSVGLYVELVL